MADRQSAPAPSFEQVQHMPVESWSADLTTRSGSVFHVRPAVPSDEAALAAFFTHVAKEDLRFRFLSAIKTIGHDQLAALVTVDHRRTENFLVIESGTGLILATAMLAADAAMKSAEVAIAIRADAKRRGISWTLLDHGALCGRQGHRDARIDRKPRQSCGDRTRTRAWLDRIGLPRRSERDDPAQDARSLTRLNRSRHPFGGGGIPLWRRCNIEAAGA